MNNFLQIYNRGQFGASSGEQFQPFSKGQFQLFFIGHFTPFLKGQVERFPATGIRKISGNDAV